MNSAPARANDTLYVIAVVSNPVRFESRYRLYREFAERMLRTAGVQLVTVEHAFGNRPFEVTDADNPWHVQVRGDQDHELWLKESLVNVGVRRLPQDWKYVAWVDADIQFARSDWASETIHALQHYAVVQPWSHSVDLDPAGAVVENEWGKPVDKSFCAAWVDGDFKWVSGNDPAEGYGGTMVEGYGSGANGRYAAPRSHYGYAWAVRREAFDAIGGLVDWLVTGSADYHMAIAFAEFPYPTDGSPGYVRRLKVFSEACKRHIRKNIGYVPGTVMHHWHGRKKQRGYISRFEVIRQSQFDPDYDLRYDWQGIPVLTGENVILRDGLRRYFRSRNEDSIDAV